MFDWIYPRTVEIVNSPINGKIKVTKFRGRYSAWVNGFEQSGSTYVEKLWNKALNNLAIKQCNNVLILGLGCGTTVPLLIKKWPKVKITGVEIDPVMIGIGKKYFGLGQYKSLKIIQSNAREYCKVSKQKFDLVLIDAYIGNKKTNLKIPRELLAKNGIAVINNLNPETLTSKIVISTNAKIVANA